MNKILGILKIRSKGEITIPKEVRKELNLKPGDRITLIFEKGQVIIKRTETTHSDFKIKE